MRPPPTRPARRLATTGLAVLLLLMATTGLRAGDEAGSAEAPRAALDRARDLEKIQGDAAAALLIYEQMAKRADFRELPDDVRADALVGGARCHQQAGRLDAAERYWRRIVEDPSLRTEAVEWAKRERAAKASSDGMQGLDKAERERRWREERRAQDAQRSRELVTAARVELNAGRLRAATNHCLEALALDKDNAEARRLLEGIESNRPDAGGLLTRLIEFFQAKEMEEYEIMQAKLERHQKNGRLALEHKKFADADRLLRDAIRLIDESGFLTLGGALNTGTLESTRAKLILWLRQTHERGREAGISFEEEPPPPDLEARRGGLQKQFFSIAAQIFSPRERGDPQLHFFKFAPLYKQGSEVKRSLSSSFTEGLRAAHSPGGLSRARWAERWIRNNIGARWVDPRDYRRGERPSRKGGSSRRILLRLGDLICAQHREGEHARIEKLRQSFATTPPALRLDVHILATDAAGAVRTMEKLRVRAGPRESGLDHVVAGRLLADCLKDLGGVEGVLHLGGAQLRLDGETSVMLELTRFTEQHPLYAKLPPPALAVQDIDARYGLWLDLYAEDMPGRTQPGNDRSALSVRARVTEPAARVASHVVPKSSPADINHTRLPLLTETSREADREVPHYGTFLLQGLNNPFPETQEAYPELIVMIGTTRQDTPTPDPPRDTQPQPQPNIVPDDTVTKDYALGALSTEVRDESFPEGWPQLRTASEGTAASDRRRLRDRNLANLLVQMTNLDTSAPGGEGAVVVQDHRVIASLDPDQHIRLQQAVMRLRSHENDLYSLTVLSAVVPLTRWRAWTTSEGVKRNVRGNFLAEGAARTEIEAVLKPLIERGGPFNERRMLLARATQQVAHSKFTARAITKDLDVRLLDHGRQRYTPVPGLAEEGLLIELRPGIEMTQSGLGLRTVRVRARAARLQRVESRAYPNATQDAALYDVPVWFPGTDGASSQRRDAEILDDKTALLLPLDLPGASEELIVILIAAKKLQ